MSCSLFSVHWYDFTNKQMFRSLISNKILKKQFFFVEDARFEKKGILLGDYHQILVTNLQGNV